ncbi:MAG TPA: energy transducer TonB [Steroidobacteraceae bacterium]|nr:energy transducer TonB [Steroidobacteraceae bacterium]
MFGLLGKPGGHELLLTVGGGGIAGGAAIRFQQFAGELQSYLKSELNRIPEILQSCYTVQVRLQVSAAGSIENVTLVESSGRRALDAQIIAALGALPPMAQAPPADMPWPIRLRVTSHRASCNP